MKTTSQYYRKDIDGLRGLAILAVIIYHLWPDLLPGGFLGVDVFFVISGYLITSIIVRETHQGSFKFTHFYIRRIIRLFPALILVLMAVVMTGYFKLFPDEFKSLGQHIAGASAFISNFILLNEVGYFDTSATKKILRHLWSLAIEEQFYLFWPLFIWLLFRFKINKYIKLIFASLFSLSLISFFYYLDKNSSLAFFLPMTRFWQIMAGALIAILNLKKITEILQSRPVTTNLLSGFSILIFLGLILFGGSQQNIDYFTAGLTTLCTVLLIISSSSFLNKRILSHKIIVYIGLISYPLYLWHWPIIVFNRLNLLKVNLNPGTYLFEILLSLLFAVLTYHFIETPIMRADKKLKIKIAPLLLAALLALGLIGLLINMNIIQSRNSNSASAAKSVFSIAKGDWDYPAFVYSKLQPNKDVPINEIPIVELGSNSAKTLFIGDSNMEQYYPRIKMLTDNITANSAVFITGGGCAPIPNVVSKTYRYCKNFLTKALELSQQPQVKSVVIAAQWYGYFVNNVAPIYNKKTGQIIFNTVPDDVFNEFKYFITELSKKNSDDSANSQTNNQLHKNNTDKKTHKKVYIVLNIPIDEKFDPEFMEKNGIDPSQTDNPRLDFNRTEFDRKMKPLNDKLRKIALETGAIIIDPMDFLCDNETCKTILDHKPIYKDFCHMNATYSREHAGFIDQVMF